MVTAKLRSAILKATAAANKLHFKYGLKSREDMGENCIDVFDIIHQENVCLCFGKLDKLHGAYLPSKNKKEGVLINSSHPLQLQRFTAAHELGHHVMKHKPSLDTDILRRATTSNYNSKDIGNSLQEMEADNFASAFLMPRWLIIKHLKSMGETLEYFTNPVNVYQMSLRLGVSYKAFCLALLSNNFSSYEKVQELLKIEPKIIKRKIISDEIIDSTNKWADVWKIDESSKSYKIVGSLNDIFILELDESPSTGYIWDFKCLLNNNFKILTNIAVSTENIDDESLVKRLGSSIKRQIVFTNTELFEGKLEITKKRPWEGNFLEKKEINFSLNGRGQGFYKKYCK